MSSTYIYFSWYLMRREYLPRRDCAPVGAICRSLALCRGRSSPSLRHQIWKQEEEIRKNKQSKGLRGRWSPFQHPNAIQFCATTTFHFPQIKLWTEASPHIARGKITEKNEVSSFPPPQSRQHLLDTKSHWGFLAAHIGNEWKGL